jgi:hypothetical protein
VGTKDEATLFIGDDNCVSAYDRPSRPNDIMKRPHLRSGGEEPRAIKGCAMLVPCAINLEVAPCSSLSSNPDESLKSWEMGRQLSARGRLADAIMSR